MIKPIKTLGAATAVFSGFALYYSPNTILVDKLQEITQHYKNAVPEPVSSNVQSLMEEVMNDMKIEEEDRKKISLYICWGFENFYGGSLFKYKSFDPFEKAIIGIPIYFNWKTITKQDKENIIVKNMKLNWDSEAGDKLANSLILSEKAKKFALSEQLFYVSTIEPLHKTTMTTILSMFGFAFVSSLYSFQHFPNRLMKRTLIGGVIFLHLGMWIASNNIYKCTLERNADEAAAKLGKEYIEGGLDYFNSIINRNIAMRTLLADQGHQVPFSIYGNEKTLIRESHLPLSERRDYFKKLLAAE